MSLNPNQIRPYENDGQLVGTLAGETVPLKVVAGTGIVVTLTGSNIVISLGTPVVPLTINSFSGGETVELGFAVVNPAFTATYTGTPTGANITNTDGTDSPHNLTTPFTAATLAGTFTHTSAADVTFTLHATDGTHNPTATQDIVWAERIFGGVGATGATSSVTATGTTAVLSTGDALPSAGLGVETVGQTFGPYMPSNQVVYLLLTGGSHTFIDQMTGFPFAFNAPIAVTFVNANGVSLSMFLYASTNALFVTVEPKIAS